MRPPSPLSIHLPIPKHAHVTHVRPCCRVGARGEHRQAGRQAGIRQPSCGLCIFRVNTTTSEQKRKCGRLTLSFTDDTALFISSLYKGESGPPPSSPGMALHPVTVTDAKEKSEEGGRECARLASEEEGDCKGCVTGLLSPVVVAPSVSAVCTAMSNNVNRHSARQLHTGRQAGRQIDMGEHEEDCT